MFMFGFSDCLVSDLSKQEKMFNAFRHNARFPKNHLHKSFHRVQNRLVEKFEQAQWEDKIKFWLRKYEDLFGITKLSEVHERVLQAQNSIQIVQEKRRKVQEELFITQKKLQESRDILHNTPMGDNQYITIVTQVHELLKEQKNLQDTFSWYDQTEREQQTTLALAINNSQDHERTYREKNKYLSLLTGVVGGVLGLIGSSINNWRHRKDIKLFENNISDHVTLIQKNVENLNLSSSHESINPKTTDIWLQMKEQQKLFQDNVNALQAILDKNVLTLGEANTDLDSQFKRISQQMENNLNSKLKYHTSVNISVISSLMLLATFLLYMSNGR